MELKSLDDVVLHQGHMLVELLESSCGTCRGRVRKTFAIGFIEPKFACGDVVYWRGLESTGSLSFDGDVLYLVPERAVVMSAAKEPVPA